MAKTDRHRWWDWRVDQSSGQSIRADDKRAPGMDEDNRGGKGWWWTLAPAEMGCRGCGRWLLPDDEIAYNHDSQLVYCPECARAEGVADQCEVSKKLR